MKPRTRKLSIRNLVGLLALSATFAPPALAAEPKVVATFEEVPVGVATSRDGRIFVSFSRAIDPRVKLSVAEVKNGKPVPYPEGLKQDDGEPSQDRLLSVQALIVDGKNRLWLLDSGKVGTNAVEPGAPKLVAVDLAQNKVVQRISFPAEIAGKTSFLNDVRVDVNRGSQGTLYITDASPQGPNGILVVDVASGKAQRRLDNHPSTRPDKGTTLKVEGKPLLQKGGPEMGKPFAVGADGIALSPDGKWLYYSPLTSHRLYRVSTDALQDADKAARAVEDLGVKGFAADGMLADAQGRVYSTDFENGAIHRRSADGKWELIAKGGVLAAWPDTLALMPDGALLVTATQIHRSPRFRGWDQRERPFQLLSVATDSKPSQPSQPSSPPASPTNPR